MRIRRHKSFVCIIVPCCYFIDARIFPRACTVKVGDRIAWPGRGFCRFRLYFCTISWFIAYIHVHNDISVDVDTHKINAG